jgi:hypothetical protein
MKTAAAYLALVAAFVVVLTLISPASEYWALASGGGLESVGSVIELDCGNHGTFRYRFSAEGKSYVAVGRNAAKPCGSLAVGETLTISYLRGDPGRSIAGNPRSELDSELRSIAFWAFAIPAIIVVGYSRRRRKHAV